MGPLSIKAQVQQRTGFLKNQSDVIKLMSDEARKNDLHKIKMAKEIAKAKAEGIELDPELMPEKVHATAKKSAQMMLGGPLSNPEAGPTDTVPTMLTPGEAVIPATVAQDPRYKPVIAGLVNAGRARNDAQGFRDGTPEVKKPEAPKERTIWEIITGSATGNEGGVGKAKKAISGRQKQLDDIEAKAVRGYADGTTEVISEDELNALLESIKGKSAADLTPKQIAAIEKATGGIDRMAAADQNAGIPDPQAGSMKQENLIKRQMSFAKDPVQVSDGERAKIMAEAQKTGDPKLIARLEQELGGASRVGTEVGRRTNVSPPIPQDEVATLQRFIANPGTGATERGRAQLRLAEIYRSQGQTQMPVIERQYQGVAAPAVRPGAPSVIPTSPSVNELRGTVPHPKLAPNVGAPVELGVDIDKTTLPPDLAAKQQAFDKVLEDPIIKKQLVALQTSKPEEGVDQKSWLADGLSKIFGDTGLFNSEDLLRFGVLAAGGLLTGGSVGGSLRFAGLAALKSSSDRLAQQRQAAAQAAHQQQATRIEGAKNIRERNEALEGTYHSKLDKADPKVAEIAKKLFEESRSGTTPYEREAKLQQAIHLLATNQVETKDGKNRAPVEGFNAKTGKPVFYLFDKDDRMLVRDGEGNFVDAKKAGVEVMSSSQFNNQETATRKSIEDRLVGNLVNMNKRPNGKPINKDFTNEEAKIQAARLTEEVMSIRADFGFDTKPEDVSKVVDETISNLKENYAGRPISDITPEALRRIVYGTAVIARRPSNKGMYMVEGPDGKPKRPGEDALQNFGNAIKTAIEEGRQKNLNLNPDQVSDYLERKYKALPDAVREKYEVSVRGELSAKGYSPYLLWVRDQYRNK